MAKDTPIIFMDGGLGTSLEDKYGLKFSHSTTPLWSSHPLVSDSRTLLACQRDFGQVPVDVIETATYQVSVPGFAATRTEQWPDGVDLASIPKFLKEAVDIAEQARGKPDATVALSLGPYGSTMIPGQEYSGSYDDAHNDEKKLCSWWADRLSLFSGDEIVGRVSYVACETLPRLDEISAVRRAISNFTSKPCWIACVFPGEGDRLPDGSSIDQMVEAMLAPAESKAQPWGIGINCTKMHKLEDLVAKFEDAVSKLIETGRVAAWPALVLYPDGTNGEVYNTTTQEWEVPVGQEQKRIPWEQQLGQIVLDTAKRQRWSTILVGGCCKASHSDIRRLVDYIRSA
ncbi:Homocysteine S-methyltransferase [Cryphonectria parasitica EP155]|uniref:Homocysteine S-methyltransferase n=1 Tax=Cryphonectria parasitica (strain ATCC 38755 / EP155) TaxID=660469 RepID=A0A9P4XXP0_CRYP1|nr:Homocysteine S-methyltransferase [Cryphonectria parasitica EP155]KAF3762824.1 Homocysteine S-methyltransferase [Cryphonectria parasitica EP155]